jgi:hypothetical protein
MDRNFYNNDDFEEFLKQKADQYKMYPSDRVWNNIYSSLHGRKRWMIAGFALLFLFSSLFIGRQAVISNYTRVATQINKVPASSFLAINEGDKRIKNYTTKQSIPVVNWQPTGNKLFDPLISSSGTSGSKNILPVNTGVADIVTPEKELSVIKNNGYPVITAPGREDHVLPLVDVKQQTGNNTVEPEAGKAKQAENNNTLPLTQNKIAAIQPAKPASLFIQFYASPIVSYRRLYNDARAGYVAPVSASYGDNINKYVHHKPALGFEAGSKIQYKLSNSLSVYAGAQLNYSRYYVDAYRFHVEKASIALNDSRLDTLSGYTDIRNFSGYSPEQLQNQYWQLSVPLGIEIKLLGNKKLQLNVAGGIQPTFLVHSNSYLISSDYKNYIQQPDMARSFNVHTNFEAFLSYRTGGIRWQLGPQFRSQLLSSYSTQYRVREYLTEFGVKFGITKSLR